MNKIRKASGICSMLFPLFLAAHPGLSPENQSDGGFRLAADTLQPCDIIRSRGRYRELVKQDPANRMVPVASLIPSLRQDLRYNDSNNFMHRPMYRPAAEQVLLRGPVAAALKRAADTLAARGYGLLVFDAYRPYSVSVAFWELVHDERYVANPVNGSGHNRGIAVDLTLYRLADGTLPDMGTGFDNFTDTAHADFRQLPAQVLANRAVLRTAMETAGFDQLPTEWWHYYYRDGAGFAVLDLPFAELVSERTPRR